MVSSTNVTYELVTTKETGKSKAAFDKVIVHTKAITVCSASANETDDSIFQASADIIYQQKAQALAEKNGWKEKYQIDFDTIKSMQKQADQEACQKLFDDKVKMQ